MVSCDVGAWGTPTIFDSHNDALEPPSANIEKKEEINDETKQEKMKEFIQMAFMCACVCVFGSDGSVRYPKLSFAQTHEIKLSAKEQERREQSKRRTTYIK